MQFIKYNVDYTTLRVWSYGVCVKDCITLTFNNKERGLVNVQVVVNYSSKRYGRMVLEAHKWLYNRYHTKKYCYPVNIDEYRDMYVIPLLDIMINRKYKSVSHFIRAYNGTL